MNKNSDINKLTNKFIKRLHGIIYSCFNKKIIQKDRGENEASKLYDKRRKLKCKTDQDSKRELDDVENN